MNIHNVPFKKLAWMPRDIDVERRADGVVVLKSRLPLEPYARHIPALLRQWSEQRPDHVWLAQRRGPDRQWDKLTYGEAMRRVDALTQAIIDTGLTADQPIAILSGNSIEHALLTQAAMQAGVPAAPVSPAYSLMSQDHAKLRYIFGLIRPGMIVVQDGPTFQRALDALDLQGMTVVFVERPVKLPAGVRQIAYEQMAAAKVTDAVANRLATIGPDSVGKLLFTSGSTGMPKAVINTQRMMCANVRMGQQACVPQPGDPAPVVLDWLPWNHTMGGNAMFHAVLAEGGTFYLDDGRPLPGLFDETLRNLREVSPTYYANVPAGYAVLATALEKDDELARSFFRQLNVLAYGGATLPSDLYDRMQALAIKWAGHRLVFTTGWGCTETAPTATSTHWETERVGLIGLPFPGVELKMVPTGPKYELRLRGVIVTPGYYNQPELTRAAFDDEGFYKIGDAGVFVDPADPSQGLVFAGRVVEDFKLTSGTFVQVGSLRVACISAATPVIHDALVAGQDRPYVGLLAWINLAACRGLVDDPDATTESLIAHPRVIETVREGLKRHNAEGGGSSTRVRRVLLMVEPPSIDGNELTDKGYINQRAALERRAALVEQLYAEPPGPEVIVIR
ncbi:MAG: AMP-binding protein [Burkholderiaceae bacterium]